MNLTSNTSSPNNTYSPEHYAVTLSDFVYDCMNIPIHDDECKFTLGYVPREVEIPVPTSPVPELSSFLMILVGVGIILLRRFRKA